MSRDFDIFCISLLQEALRFLEKAESAADAEAKHAYAHAALLLGYASLEAHVNAIADELAQRPEFSAHEKSLLLERTVRLEKGEFTLSATLQMWRLEDRIHFLFRRFSGDAIPAGAAWWINVKAGLDLRNTLTHPKDVPLTDPPAVRRTLEAIIEAVDQLYQTIYKRAYPPSKRGTRSSMDF